MKILNRIIKLHNPLETLLILCCISSIYFFSCQLPGTGARACVFDYELQPMKELINDHSLKYKIIIWETLDGVNFYVVDTLNVKSDDVFIKHYR
jgi:hypothetical protein